MAHRLDNVLAELERQTRDHKASWRTSGRPAELLVPLKSGLIVVLSNNPYSELFGGGRPGPFRLAALSESGSELTAIEARPDDEYYGRLRALYDEASARAIDVDRQVARIEQELASLGA